MLLANPGQYPRVLIADFGLAKEQASEPTGNVAGTVSYLPPEAITAITLKNKYSTEGGDSWSLGVIIFIMLQYVLFPSRLYYTRPYLCKGGFILSIQIMHQRKIPSIL